MAHADKRIAEIEAELTQLRADRDAENAVLTAPRPAGIPATWEPITFKRGQADWLLIGWLDPDFEASVFTRASRGVDRPRPPGPPNPPGPPSP